MNQPDTRASLILRIRDPDDRDAWYEFAEIYRPVVQRLAVGKGMQAADADDLAQQVLVAVAGAVDRWEPDNGRAKFRTWLRRIAENAILNALTRGPRDNGAADSRVHSLLNAEPSRSGPDSNLLQIEFRREVFNWAAKQIRDEFGEATWNAFWLTAVDGEDVNVVARRLDKNRGSVYAARSRVMKRLKEKVEEFELGT